MIQATRTEYCWAALVFAGLVLAFCHPLFQGLLLSQSDFIYFVKPWDSIRPEVLTDSANPFLQDQTTEFLAFFLEAKKQLADGLFPLWNPYIFTGTPLWANTQSALLFPLNWFHYVLTPPWGFAFSGVLKLFFGCFFSYHLARTLNRSHGAALVAGVAYGFCAFSVFWLNHPHVNAMVLMPLCFVCLEHWLRQPNLKTASVYAAMVGFSILSGHVEIAFITAFGCGVYALVRLWQIKQFTPRRLAQFMGIYVGSLAFAAILVLPFVEFLMHTAVWEERGDSFSDAMPQAGWPSLLIHNLFSGAGWSERHTGFNAFTPFIGLSAMALMILTWLKRSPETWALWSVFVLALMIAFGLPPVYQVVNALPLFSHLPLFYFSVLMVLSGSQLAAAGWDVLLSQGLSRLQALLWVLGGLAVLLLLVWVWDAEMLLPFVQSADALNTQVRAGVGQGMLVVLLLALLGLLLVKQKRLATAGLVLLLFAELWQSGQSWNPFIKPEHGFPQTQPGSIQYLQQQPGPFRVVGHDYILKPSMNMLADLQDIRGYDVPVFDRYHDFFNQVLGGKDSFWYYDLPKFNPEALPYLSAMNVQYIMSQKALAETDGLRLVYDEEIKLYRNEMAKARAYLVDQASFVETPEAAIESLLHLKSDLSDRVVLESAPIESGDVILENIESLVTIAAWEANQVTMAVHSPTDAWLVLSQSVYPGWKATIDGQKVDIVPANLLAQAIRIPAGKHVVKFKYRPMSFYMGVLISLFSVLLLIWVMRKPAKS